MWKSALALAIVFAAPAALAEDRFSYGPQKDDLRHVEIRMEKDDVESVLSEGEDVDYDKDCRYHRAATHVSTSSLECRLRQDTVDPGDEYNLNVEFTSSLTRRLVYQIRYKFCSVYSYKEVEDEVTRQFNAVHTGGKDVVWLFNDKDGTRITVISANHEWCPSNRRGWEIVMVSKLLLDTDNRRRHEAKNPDLEGPKGPDF